MSLSMRKLKRSSIFEEIRRDLPTGPGNVAVTNVIPVVPVDLKFGNTNLSVILDDACHPDGKYLWLLVKLTGTVIGPPSPGSRSGILAFDTHILTDGVWYTGALPADGLYNRPYTYSRQSYILFRYWCDNDAYNFLPPNRKQIHEAMRLQ